MKNWHFIEVENLKKHFFIRKDKVLKAVDNISFYIEKGETLGLVGESGCGKSTCGRTMLGLYPPTSGSVYFNNKNIYNLKGSKKKEFKKKAQIIMQDPYASLDPRMVVKDIISEGMEIHKLYSVKERTERVYELLELVGLNKEHISRFPHEFSGGQRQRIGIARALAIEPEFIVCDEPISALDVSIQAQVVNLLIKLQKKLGLTYLFIAHDLAMVKHISDRIAVMYLGNIVEITNSRELYDNPCHPYTKSLLSVIPIPNPELEKNKKKVSLKGEVPSPINPKPGCKFASRCNYVQTICKEKNPELKNISEDHFVACYLF